MAEIDIIDQEEGPHLGWRRQYFMWEGQRYELFTIDRDDEKRSSIRIMKSKYDGDGIVYLDCLLTPEAARDIIVKLNRVRIEAYERGRNSLRHELKNLLNIS